MSKKILVTGGTGLVGSQLVFDLIQSGEQVTVLKRSGSDLGLINSVFKGNEPLLDKIEWFDGDILDVTKIFEACKGIEQVYHCAAKVSFDSRHQSLLHKVNTEGTANVVNACLENKVEKLCYVSSVAALGRERDNQHIDESTQWKRSNHNSNYAISKYAAENEVWRGIAEGLNAVIVNPTIIIGPGNWKTDSSALFGKVYDGLSFYTNGVNGYVDVRDVSAAMIQLMNSSISEEKFLLVSENLSYKSFFTLVANALNKKPPFISANNIMRSIAWRGEWLRSAITGKPQVITKETARTSAHTYYYSSAKIQKALGFSFRPVTESVSFTCNKLLQQRSK